MSPLLGRSEVRWGILGCGDVTERKSGPGFQRATRSRLVAVMRRDPVLAEDYARRHGVPRWYSDANRLISDPEVDAVYIATPPHTHAELALRVAAAGKPAYVEKPMAMNTTECDAMLAAFAQASLPLFVAYYRRALPRFVTVKELYQSGAIGRLSAVHYMHTAPRHRVDDAWRVDVGVAGGGLFLDLGCHVLDLIDFLVGPLGGAQGHAAKISERRAAEEVVAMSFQAGGVPGVGLWNYAADQTEEVCRLIGTEGQLEFSVFEEAPVKLRRGGAVELFERPHPPHVQEPLIQSIVNALLDGVAAPSTGESARRAAQVVDTVLNDYYGGRSDAFWKRLKIT